MNCEPITGNGYLLSYTCHYQERRMSWIQRIVRYFYFSESLLSGLFPQDSQRDSPPKSGEAWDFKGASPLYEEFQSEILLYLKTYLIIYVLPPSGVIEGFPLNDCSKASRSGFFTELITTPYLRCVPDKRPFIAKHPWRNPNYFSAIFDRAYEVPS